MGQKVHPKGFRLSVKKDWESSWYANKRDYGKNVTEDYFIRNLLKKRLKHGAVSLIQIERAGERIRGRIVTGRPGIVIGRKGQELDKLKLEIQKLANKDIILDIIEVKKPELDAQIVAETIALQLERRISFRRAMKKAMQ